MNRTIRRSFHLVVLGTALLGGATVAGAQCTNTGGGPPTPEPMLVIKTTINRGLGGLWGDGNDRYTAVKGMFTASVPVDPVTTHDVHITIRKNGDSGPIVFATTLPVGSFWTPSGSSFVYFDPSDTYGVRRFFLKNLGGGLYLITRIVGRNVSLANVPLTSGDSLHMMLEFESGGAGDCFGDDLPLCTYGVAAQFCFS